MTGASAACDRPDMSRPAVSRRRCGQPPSPAASTRARSGAGRSSPPPASRRRVHSASSSDVRTLQGRVVQGLARGQPARVARGRLLDERRLATRFQSVLSGRPPNSIRHKSSAKFVISRVLPFTRTCPPLQSWVAVRRALTSRTARSQRNSGVVRQGLLRRFPRTQRHHPRSTCRYTCS